jgi:hypothetical protein
MCGVGAKPSFRTTSSIWIVAPPRPMRISRSRVSDSPKTIAWRTSPRQNTHSRSQSMP